MVIKSYNKIILNLISNTYIYLVWFSSKKQYWMTDHHIFWLLFSSLFLFEIEMSFIEINSWEVVPQQHQLKTRFSFFSLGSHTFSHGTNLSLSPPPPLSLRVCVWDSVCSKQRGLVESTIPGLSEDYFTSKFFFNFECIQLNWKK